MLWRRHYRSAQWSLVILSSLLLGACGSRVTDVPASSDTSKPADTSSPTPDRVVGSTSTVIGQATAGISPTFHADQALTTTDGSEVIVVGHDHCGSTTCSAIATSPLSSSLATTRWQTITLPNIGYQRVHGATILSNFAFANDHDGFALYTRYAHSSIATRLFATTDGGIRWHLIADPPQLSLEATFTSHALVSLTGNCSDREGALACSRYELMRISLSTDQRELNPLPVPTQPYPFLEQPSLAAQGSTVAVLADPTGPRTAYPRLYLSKHGDAPYADLVRPALVGVTACTLVIRKPALWATCPTGMMISDLHAATLTGTFTQFWERSGTFGDDSLAPISAEDAYRLVTNQSETSAALQLTTNGGRQFHTVAAVNPPQFAIGGSSLCFVSLRAGFLTVQSFTGHRLSPTLWGTTTAGQSWTKIFPPPGGQAS